MRRLAVAALLTAGCAAAVDPLAPPPPPAELARAQQPAEPTDPADEPARTPAKTSSVSALTGKIKLPADGGTWPASLGSAPPPVDGKGVTVALEYGVHDMVVSPETGRFLIAERLGLNRRADPRQPTTTHFVLGDVVAGKVLGEWDVGGDYEPFDLSPDGTRFLVKPGGNKLTVFTPAKDGKLVGHTFVAHDRVTFNAREEAEQQREMGVRWAAFVGANRIVSAAAGGQVRVFKADTLDRVGTLDGTAELVPCVTPDRKRVVAHAAGRAVLIDAADGMAVGTKPWPLPGGSKVLVASPDGSTLACGRQGRIRFLTVKTGEFWDQMMPDFGDDQMNVHRFAWTGPTFLTYNRKVYDPAVPYMVWHLSHQSHADGYSSRQVWAAARLRGDEAKSGPPLRAHVRPHAALPPDLAGIVAAAKTRPGIYVLPAGAAVRVDATRLPAAKQAAAKADLEQRLGEVGYAVRPTAGPTFVLSLDPPATKTTTYRKAQNVSYTAQPLRVQLRHEGKVLQQWALMKDPPAFYTPGAAGGSLSSRATTEGWGLPDYAALKTVYIQPHFPGPAFPREGFGFTELSPDGPKYRGGPYR